MQKEISEFLSQKKFAVAGSFINEKKVAYRILMLLQEKGYETYPVNPRKGEVAGVVCYASVKDIPVTCDVVDLITPPEASERIVQECKEKGIRRVWFQPGADSAEAIRFCQDNDISVVYGHCIIQEMP